MKTRLLFPVLPVVISLAGCASLSETECADADWEQIGYRDGAAGASARRIEAHRKACAEYGVDVDADTYSAGYDQGIDAYCTPVNAVRAGLSGGGYTGVCPGEAGRVFQQYYGAARAVYEQRQRVAALEQQRRVLRQALDDADTDQQRQDIAYELRRLDRVLFAEMDRLRYAESRLVY
jgi:Protein of unknown function (DUF2799)